MTLIAERLVPILRSLPQGVRLAAVSKFHPVEELMEAYEAGQRVFAESRVQELMSKVEAMPDDVEWHFIGPLQTNKVKYIVPFISMIQSVSSLKLFDEISRQASKVGRTVPILLEVHIASEDTKSGFTPEELPQVLEAVLARGSDTGTGFLPDPSPTLLLGPSPGLLPGPSPAPFPAPSPSLLSFPHPGTGPDNISR